MEEAFIKYYDLDKYISTEVKGSFNKQGFLSAFDFFCIVIWKANRIHTKIAKWLLEYYPNENLNDIVKKITSSIKQERDRKEKLRILWEHKGFNLAMASAILTILYPTAFTIYDIRVCGILGKHKGLNSINDFDTLWNEYEKYQQAVTDYPLKGTLRKKDKILWGKSFHKQLSEGIQNKFKK